MNKIIYIIQGFFNLLSTKLGFNDDIEYINMVNHRLTLCNDCENNTKTLGRCKLCGCYCRAKVSVLYDIDKDGISIDGCPLRKW